MMVEDVNRTVDFYRDVLGFELVMTVPEQGIYHWALIKRGDLEMMFQARASLEDDIPSMNAVGGALTFYIDMDDVAALYERIRSNVKVVQDIHTTFYGTREFSIQDCNGFILTFAEGCQN